MPEHILKRFDAELSELQSLIGSMFKVVRKNIKRCAKALSKGDEALARKIIKQDAAVNALEVQIDDTARKLIVHHQPTAIDLRLVFAAIKIVTDLERMGDLASDMARDVLRLEGRVPRAPTPIPVLQELILDQLERARRAYAGQNIQQARQVIERDRLVDEEFSTCQRVLLTYMAKDSSSISWCTTLSDVAKRLERIGDHATNVAEMVIYTAVGHEVRHIDLDELKALLEEDDDDV